MLVVPIFSSMILPTMGADSSAVALSDIINMLRSFDVSFEPSFG